MTVLNEIKVQLVQRVKGQRSGERSTGEGSTMSSTLQSLMNTHLSMLTVLPVLDTRLNTCRITKYD